MILSSSRTATSPLLLAMLPKAYMDFYSVMLPRGKARSTTLLLPRLHLEVCMVWPKRVLHPQTTAEASYPC